LMIASLEIFFARKSGHSSKFSSTSKYIGCGNHSELCQSL
jgi:hypothetical protein